jgi:uncharacterized FAD-dependent dehydrogenase
MSEHFDVAIIGAGPTGIFTALKLSQENPSLRIIILDKGHELEKRRCPAQLGSQGAATGKCIQCNPCHVLSGWGGAGAFSDGKLTLSPEVGGNLGEYLDRERLQAIIGEVDKVYSDFGAKSPVFGTDMDEVERLQKKAAKAGLRLLAMPVRHIGTENCRKVLHNLHKELLSRGVEIRMRTPVARILAEDSVVKGVETEKGERIEATFVVMAPGREGASWLTSVAKELNLSLDRNPVDIGVRVEVPAVVMEPLTNVLYESKLFYTSRAFDDKVRTFCMNPYGEVVLEYVGDVITVNGHSYANRKTLNTNFAILVSKRFTEPFKDPIAYGKSIARLANLLGGGVIVQRLGDLEQGRRSTPERLCRSIVTPTLKDATPGDLGLVLPYRYLVDILEMLRAMDELVPGIYSPHTLLYGVEVKFYSSRLKLTPSLETEVKNLFAAGDGAGVTRGLVQASASGLIVAEEILRRVGS